MPAEMNHIDLPTATFRRVRAAAGGSKRPINSWLLCLIKQYRHQRPQIADAADHP